MCGMRLGGGEDIVQVVDFVAILMKGVQHPI